MNRAGRLILLISTVILIAGAIVLVRFRRMEVSAENDGGTPRPVRTAVPRRFDLEETVEAWGNLKSADQVTILPKVSGSVTSLMVEVGDQVEAGQVVAEIDREAYRLDYQRAEASRSASASTWERFDRLYASGSAAEQDWENARAAYLAAEAQAATAALLYDWTLVSSPTDGVVLIRHVNTGSLVSPDAGTPVYTVGSLDDLELEVQLPENWYPAFAGDDLPDVRLTADAFPEMRVEGRIRSVAPWVDPGTRSFQVICAVSLSEDWLRPGMLVSADFVVNRRQDALVLPSSALTAGRFLWGLDDDGRAFRVELEHPRLIGDHLLIPDDLAGYAYVTEGQHFLKEGDLLHRLDGESTE